jgi:pyroglutamyl-peptidase
VWVLSVLTALCYPDHDLRALGAQPQQTNNTRGKLGTKPVILLTGFEPFGQVRSPNSSWEGIKALDGKEWKGYQLVAKQMSCIWGAPMEQLPAWIAEYHPVAILSFGQGTSGSFAVESKAGNVRSPRARDNLGELAPSPTIVTDGPGTFDATIPCDKFACVLAAKGYTTRVSTKAGRYLCEETLYALEYLKSTKRLKGTVMFCHVPPLNTPVHARGAPRTVTADYVEEFVKDALEGWHTVIRNETKRPR